jgi:Putative prokaryotic signal transducing protein
MKRVFVARDLAEAKIVKDLLEGSDIVAGIRDKSPFAIHSLDENRPNPAIWIRDEDVQKALTILAEYLHTSLEHGQG